MKYYCKNCGSVFISGEKDNFGKPLSLPPINKAACHCPFCELTKLEFGIIPDYETPVQYQERTGELYSDYGAVWVRHKTEGYSKEYWQLSRYIDTKNGDCRDLGCIVVIASPPVPPPDDFVPEEK